MKQRQPPLSLFASMPIVTTIGYGQPKASRQNDELRRRRQRNKNMRMLILLAAACLCSCPIIAETQNQPSDNKPAPKRAPQLDMRVPFEPTAFPSGPHFYVMYELYLTNFGAAPLTLSRIEVLDADVETAQPIATFEAEQLEAMLQPLGGRTLSDRKERLVIAGGQSAIVFMSVEFDRGSRIANRLAGTGLMLRFRVTTHSFLVSQRPLPRRS